jgi:hypothetical protein
VLLRITAGIRARELETKMRNVRAWTGLPLILTIFSGSNVTAAPASHKVTMSCEEFLSLDEATRPKVIYWAEGLNKKGRPEDATLDIARTESLIPVIVETCQQQPKASFWQKARMEWTKLERSVKSHL